MVRCSEKGGIRAFTFALFVPALRIAACNTETGEATAEIAEALFKH